jgi:very-short-patch-repair endonuclease
MRTKDFPVVRGQRVDPLKLALAKQFRRNPTKDEGLLWEQIRRERLGGLHFRRQQLISGFIVDFYCAAARLAIELDGPIHAEQIEEDCMRDRALLELGIRTVRIDSQAVNLDMASVLLRIAAAAAQT